MRGAPAECHGSAIFGSFWTRPGEWRLFVGGRLGGTGAFGGAARRKVPSAASRGAAAAPAPHGNGGADAKKGFVFKALLPIRKPCWWRKSAVPAGADGVEQRGGQCEQVP